MNVFSKPHAPYCPKKSRLVSFTNEDGYALISYIWDGEKDIRISFAPNIKYKPNGDGFVLRDYSIENSDGVRYLRLYGGGGMVSSSSFSSRRAKSNPWKKSRSTPNLWST